MTTNTIWCTFANDKYFDGIPISRSIFSACYGVLKKVEEFSDKSLMMDVFASCLKSTICLNNAKLIYFHVICLFMFYELLVLFYVHNYVTKSCLLTAIKVGNHTLNV